MRWTLCLLLGGIFRRVVGRSEHREEKRIEYAYIEIYIYNVIHRAREREQDREKWGKKEKREMRKLLQIVYGKYIHFFSLHATSVIIFN